MSITVIKTKGTTAMMSPSDRKHLVDLLEELDALIACDDGTCFPWKVCEKVDIAKEILGVISRPQEEEEDD